MDVEIFKVQDSRKLVTRRVITALLPIEGADAIELAQVDGWRVVVKKGEFTAGDACVYLEIDSFLPDGVPAWQFLVDKQHKMFNGVKGHKLRTIRLRGQISQGLVLPVSALPVGEGLQDQSLDELFGVVKYDPPLNAQLAGLALGLFPSFIRKTDQERCQNCARSIFGYTETLVPVQPGIPPEALAEGVSAGRLRQVGDEYFFIHPAVASQTDEYEITMKLDGSSMTAYGRLIPGEDGTMMYDHGVCSRNLQLKISEDNSGNAFVRLYQDSGLQAALEELVRTTGRSFAVQGELMGPNIQGNREQLAKPELYVFDIYDIGQGLYLPPVPRMNVFFELVTGGAGIKHVPVLDCYVTLPELGLRTVDDLLKAAEGPSIKHASREGNVYKRMDGQFSFKAISNLFLAKEKD